MTVPRNPKIYHIVHVDRLQSIIETQGLLCDEDVIKKQKPGTPIGLQTIKQRRLKELTLSCYTDLHVGSCVPFYFCPRSIMLYVIYKGNFPELHYKSGQKEIIHLEADLFQTVKWAEHRKLRWAFTLTNAGSRFFEARNDLSKLSEIDWNAVQAQYWEHHKDGKQAEFLVEKKVAWTLFGRIGVHNPNTLKKVKEIITPQAKHQPILKTIPDWYY